MKPIIVGVDASPHSDEALRQADDWARRRGARLVLCHVLPRGVGTGTLLEGQLAERVRGHAAELIGRGDGDIEVAVDEGAADECLLRQAEARDAALIVVGSHGEAGLKRIFLGDVAEALLRNSPRPIMVARPHARTGRILVGTDFSRPARRALELAAEEARLRGGRLTLCTSIEQYMHAVQNMTEFGSGGMFVQREYLDERKKAEKQLHELFAEVGADGDVLVTAESPAAALVETAARLDGDLVVVGAVGGGTLARLRRGRVMEKVARHVPCSVLVVPEPQP
jgi:nucleotide-binding universal stress UspA family protein